MLDIYKALTALHIISSAFTYAKAVETMQKQSCHLAFPDAVFAPLWCFNLIYFLSQADLKHVIKNMPGAQRWNGANRN